MKPRKEYENGLDRNHHDDQHDDQHDVDIYNYDDASDEEDSGPRVKGKSGHVIELNAKIDTDDEFHGGHEEEDDDDGASMTPPLRERSSTPPLRKDQRSSVSPKKSLKSSKSSKQHYHSSSASSSKKDKQYQSSKSSSVSSSQRSPKVSESEPNTGTPTKVISFLPKKYLEGNSWTKVDKEGAPPMELRKRTDSSSSSNLSGGDGSYDGEYFKRMASRSKDAFHDPTDKELFIENIWKHIKGKALFLCAHKSSTDCIIWFIESVRDNAILRKLTDDFSVDRLSADALVDEHVSSVMEALVEALIRVLTEEEEKEFDTSTARWCIKYLDALAKLIEDNIVQLLSDSVNGCRIVIVVIEAIGGIRIGRHWSRQNMRFGSGVKVNLQTEIEKDISFKELPSPFKHHLKRFAKCLVLELSEDDIKDLLFGRATQVAQYLLFILKVRYPELCQMVVKKLVEVVFDRRLEDRETITQSASSAYIIEIIMMVASETRLSKIWTKYLKGSLESMWRHDIANFIVQRLIDAIKEENLFADVCAEIFPDLGEIFKCNRAGIGVCLAKACQEFKKMQYELINALLKAYDCYEPKEKQLDLVPSMLFIELKVPPVLTNKYTPGGGYQNHYQPPYQPPYHPPAYRANQFDSQSKIQIWLHGSLMLQYMMSFADPHKVCKSLLSLSTDDIVKIAKDRSGSHVIDAFIHGNNVPLKHKSELVERFLGRYHNMSLDKFGSRIVENIISLSDHHVKRAIMDELSQHEATLTSNRNGWFVAKKVGLSTFRNRPMDWRTAEQSRERKKRVFSEFVSGPLGPNRGQGPSAFGNGGNYQLTKRTRF